MTDIQPCPKCKKAQGYNWTWGKNDDIVKDFQLVKRVVLNFDFNNGCSNNRICLNL